MEPEGLTKDEMQARALQAAQLLVGMWPVVLEGIKGMIAQTMQLGFDEAESRAIVLAFMGARQQ